MNRLINKIVLTPLFLALTGCATFDRPPLNDARYQADRALKPFASLAAVERYAGRVRKIKDIEEEVRRAKQGPFEEVMVTGARSSAPEPITNNQEAGVDEGDIVKFSGQYLIILRQGKLYSVDLDHNGSGQLKKVNAVDVSFPTSKMDAWYDELLIHDDIVLVIGYSYELEVSLLVFFELQDDGRLEYSKTYLIDSADYYDSENYAGRLVDGNLVLYLVNAFIPVNNDEPFESAYNPAVGLIDRHGKLVDSYSLFDSHTVFSPVQHTVDPNIFTAVVCPLSREKLRCSARSIIADRIDAHYVSPNAVYMWGSSYGWAFDIARTPLSVIRRAIEAARYETPVETETSVIYRFPLDDASVTAVEASGHPLDQFSFSEQDGNLFIVSNVSEQNDGGYFNGTYLARVPLTLFSPSVLPIPDTDFRLISDSDGSWGVNRFINDHLVYANRDRHSTLYVSRLVDASAPTVLESDFTVSRIQPVGGHALLMGYRYRRDAANDTAYSTVSLSDTPAIMDTFTQPGSELAESRSHGFNYRPLQDGGMFGVPLFIELDDEGYKTVDGKQYEALPAVDMQYFGLTADLAFYDMGSLAGNRNIQWQSWSDCEVSCYDWYGSSRPFFIGERIFALLKNELVEGYLSSHSIHEKQRIDVFD